MDTIKEKEVQYLNRKYRVEILQDDCSCMGWDDLGDHLGTIYSNHRRWNPDNHKVEEILDDENRPDSENYVYVPIWMYEHSGITIKACGSNPYSCPWDSGCAGLIAVSKDKILKEYGSLDEETIKKAKDVMIAEIHDLDLIYTGNVYGYSVIYLGDDDEGINDGEGEEIDSCWGFVIDYLNLDEVISEGEAVAIADAKDWYRKNGIQLRIPFPKDEGEE